MPSACAALAMMAPAANAIVPASSCTDAGGDTYSYVPIAKGDIVAVNIGAAPGLGDGIGQDRLIACAAGQELRLTYVSKAEGTGDIVARLGAMMTAKARYDLAQVVATFAGQGIATEARASAGRPCICDFADPAG